MSKQLVEVGIWKRYETYDLEITPSLAGAVHHFEQEGLTVKFVLPRKPLQKDWHSENSPITCWGYRQNKNRKVPLSFSVHQVDAYIETDRKRSIRADALGAVNVSLFSGSERSRLDHLANEAAEVIDRAFDYWITIIRWKAENPTICQLSYNRQRTRWGSYLFDVKTRKRFYAPPLAFVAQGTTPITKQQWKRAQEALSIHSEVPLCWLYFAEAHQRLRIDDIRGFIISLAIASETLIRQITQQFLREPINPTYQSMVNGISIGRIIDNWRKLGFDGKRWDQLKKEKEQMKRVLELRNGIMHRGETPKLPQSAQRELSDAVKKFLKEGERQLKRN